MTIKYAYKNRSRITMFSGKNIFPKQSICKVHPSDLTFWNCAVKLQI